MMNAQQIIVFLIVGAAVAYLGRNGVRAWKALWRGKSGCGDGCGKCGFARKETDAAPTKLLSLQEIRVSPKKQPK
jgi:hypothetical protein